MMAEYTDLARFKAIYVVDLCHSLCEVARTKLSGPHFKNVHVVEGDACTFMPEKIHVPADVITYSYSLSSASLCRHHGMLYIDACNLSDHGPSGSIHSFHCAPFAIHESCPHLPPGNPSRSVPCHGCGLLIVDQLGGPITRHIINDVVFSRVRPYQRLGPQGSAEPRCVVR